MFSILLRGCSLGSLFIILVHVSTPPAKYMKKISAVETMKWISTAIMLLAALAIVEGVYPTSIYLLNLGSLAWLITAIMWREWSLIVVNASLLLVYVYGLAKVIL